MNVAQEVAEWYDLQLDIVMTDLIHKYGINSSFDLTLISEFDDFIYLTIV